MLMTVYVSEAAAPVEEWTMILFLLVSFMMYAFTIVSLRLFDARLRFQSSAGRSGLHIPYRDRSARTCQNPTTVAL